MPQMEVRRAKVSDQLARQVSQRLRRSGELELFVNIMLDHAEYLDGKLLEQLQTELLTDAKGLAAFHAVQGAVTEIKRMARIIWTLGDPTEAAAIPPPRRTAAPTARTTS